MQKQQYQTKIPIQPRPQSRKKKIQLCYGSNCLKMYIIRIYYLLTNKKTKINEKNYKKNNKKMESIKSVRIWFLSLKWIFRRQEWLHSTASSNTVYPIDEEKRTVFCLRRRCHFNHNSIQCLINKHNNVNASHLNFKGQSIFSCGLIYFYTPTHLFA